MNLTCSTNRQVCFYKLLCNGSLTQNGSWKWADTPPIQMTGQVADSTNKKPCETRKSLSSDGSVTLSL